MGRKREIKESRGFEFVGSCKIEKRQLQTKERRSCYLREDQFRFGHFKNSKGCQDSQRAMDTNMLEIKVL